MRVATIERTTNETQITMSLDLDGAGNYQIHTGIGFFDHMLSHTAKHGLLNLQLAAKGDLEVDPHHTVEDVGIVFGQALKEALKTKRGINRYGCATIPMDEALAMVAVDLGGRPYLRFQADLGKGQLGNFDLELVPEFFQAVSVQAGMNIHIRLLDGANFHHAVEAIFKAFGRALAEAVTLNERIKDVPSTKGTL